jgi:hypothetical protein
MRRTSAHTRVLQRASKLKSPGETRIGIEVEAREENKLRQKLKMPQTLGFNRREMTLIQR